LLSCSDNRPYQLIAWNFFGIFANGFVSQHGSDDGVGFHFDNPFIDLKVTNIRVYILRAKNEMMKMEEK
jgi:hypothetical protein